MLHAMAMVHVAMFETLNFIDGRYASRFVVPSSKLDGLSREAAAAAAAHHVLVDAYPAQKDALDASLKASLDTIENRSTITGSVTTGKSVASVIYALRRPQPGDARTAESPAPAEPWLVDGVRAVQTAPASSQMQPVSATFAAGQEPAQYFGSVVGALSWNPAVAQVIAGKRIDLIHAARIHALVSMAAADAYLIGGDGGGTRQLRQTFIELDGRPSVAMVDVNVAQYACKACAAATAAATILDAEFGSSDGAAIAAGEDMGRQIGQYALRHYYRAN
jgi:hypothetical protein